MANSFVQIYIHLIFHVKSTGVTMASADLPRIFTYIGGIIRKLGGMSIIVGGMTDHVHSLSSLPKTMSMSDFARTIKAESSKWIKKLHPSYLRFAWQDGYGAFSVSPSLIEKTKDYINNQEKHHKVRSFREELKAILEAYGVEYDEKYLLGE